MLEPSPKWPLGVFFSNSELKSRAQYLFQKRERHFILESLLLALNGPRARLSWKSLVAVSLSCVPLNRALDITAICSCLSLLCKMQIPHGNDFRALHATLYYLKPVVLRVAGIAIIRVEQIDQNPLRRTKMLL